MSMKKGDKGPEIVILQGVLQKLDFAIKADGIFGAETEEAVKQFQHEIGASVDGLVGTKTAEGLVQALHLGINEVQTV